MEYPALIRKIMSARKWTQTRLAAELRVTQPTVSRWLKGSQPDIEQHHRIMELVQNGRGDAGQGTEEHIESSDVATSIDRPPKRMVRLVGYVGAGSEAHYYALADEDYTEVEAPPGATDQTVAVEIRGKSFGPLMDTWLVFYRDVRSPVGPELYGRICVVGLADDRILIKKIQHNRDGSFTLVSNSGDPPIENAQIEWAAKVTDMRPKDEGK